MIFLKNLLVRLCWVPAWMFIHDITLCQFKEVQLSDKVHLCLKMGFRILCPFLSCSQLFPTIDVPNWTPTGWYLVVPVSLNLHNPYSFGWFSIYGYNSFISHKLNWWNVHDTTLNCYRVIDIWKKVCPFNIYVSCYFYGYWSISLEMYQSF